MAAVIFVGLLWKRGNSQGAIAGVLAGFTVGLICFLDQTRGWKLALLSHPFLHSFLHRTLIAWLVAAAVMMVISLATKPPQEGKVTQNVFGEFSAAWKGLGDYRLAAGVLLLCTVFLWLSFR